MGTWVSKTAVSLILLQNLTRGYLKPFISHFLHNQIQSNNRATIMSIKSAMVDLTSFLGLAVFSLILRFFPLSNALQILGTFTLAMGIFLVTCYWKIFQTKKTN